jgi:DNA-binding MarR family transcriptional regulator
MPSRSRRRAALLDAVERGFQDVSTAGGLLHTTIAERLGLNITDHKCMGMLLRFGSMTAGDLARHAGLTTGAITGVINRLERAGYAERRVPKDRRSIVVHPVNADRFLRRMRSAIGGLRTRMRVLADRYTDEQLAVLDDFMRQAVAISREEQTALRARRDRMPS